MQQMYKVFYNDRVIILCEKSKKTVEIVADKFVSDRGDLFAFLDKLMGDELHEDVVILGYSISEMYNDFISWFTYIEAAGGIAQNPEGKFLFIKRWGIWDLPKGKIEKNESPENAAKREIAEETGVGKLEIRKKLKNTYHIYQLKQQFFLKCTFWYLMYTNDNNLPRPQHKEGIDEVVWMTRKQSKKVLSGSYRSLRETFRSVFG
jgi:8-oxo-dGTP pyrophosphatase MutT (NUDIX family)